MVTLLWASKFSTAKIKYSLEMCKLTQLGVPFILLLMVDKDRKQYNGATIIIMGNNVLNTKLQVDYLLSQYYIFPVYIIFSKNCTPENLIYW